MRARLAALGVPVPAQRAVVDAASADVARRSAFPCVLKTTRGGYDGKGVWFVAYAGRRARRRSRRPRATGVRAPGRGAGRLPPRAVRAGGPLALAARPRRTRSSSRLQRDGICREVIAPAPGPRPRARRAGAGRSRCGSPRELDVTGILAVELFETDDGRVLVNELAMRPHNTGHWTQDGAVTVQFENHLRAVLDLPLGSPVAAGAVDGDGQHPRRPDRLRRPAVRRLPARPRARPAAAGAPVRQGAASRAARSATSTPTATTWRTVCERARHAAAWFARRPRETRASDA